MRLVPLSYNVRSLLVRRGPTVLTVLGIAATVATVAGVLALQQGFATLYQDNGREDIGVVLRQGSTAEGVSSFYREGANRIVKSSAEWALGPDGAPLAGMECFLAVRRFRVDGGETNVPLRGVQPATMEIRAPELSVVEGRPFSIGSDEVIVGRRITDRIADCRVGDT
ncbi:MAG: ABC transporter permease, partial [Bacteroidota bacterium]